MRIDAKPWELCKNYFIWILFQIKQKSIKVITIKDIHTTNDNCIEITWVFLICSNIMVNSVYTAFDLTVTVSVTSSKIFFINLKPRMLKSLAKLSNILAQTHKNFRSSCPKGVLRNLAKSTGKHLRQSLFFLAEACKFIKKGTLALKIFDIVPNIGKETMNQFRL